MRAPREATVAVTYRCNSRCIMCNIWKVEEHEELAPQAYSKLPRSLKTINITGGEPFLRDDLIDVVREIHKAAPHARIVISTNGVLTSPIEQSMRKIMELHPRIGIGVSIDGSRETHDQIRGIKGSYDRAIQTVRMLKQIGVTDIRLGMTLMKENVDQAFEVYQLSKELGVEFTTTVAHNSDIYFKKNDNAVCLSEAGLKRSLGMVVKEHLRSFRVKNWFRAYHLAGIADRSVRRLVSRSCPAGSRFFFMDPRGSIYPCLVLDKPMGNTREVVKFDEILSGSKAEEVRRQVLSCRADCWMVCNTRSMILTHPAKAIGWIAKHKLAAHFSRDA